MSIRNVRESFGDKIRSALARIQLGQTKESLRQRKITMAKIRARTKPELSTKQRKSICINTITKAKLLSKGHKIDAIDFNSNLTAKEKAERIKKLFNQGNDQCINKVINEDYKDEIEQEKAQEEKLARISLLKEELKSKK